MRGVIVVSAAFAAAVAFAAGTSASGGERADRIQRVTLIGDSIADGVARDKQAMAILGQGIDLDLEVAPCRRVDQDSCPMKGVRPPNVVQLVTSMGSKLGPYVVVCVGYNDNEDLFAGNVENALSALRAAGVQRVWWLTLRAARHPYVNMNEDLKKAAERHSELTVIDWNVYSRSHPDWFEADGLHLRGQGAEAMARLIHETLRDDGITTEPVRVATTTLPSASRGKRYAARLAAARGLAPYTWSLLARAPKGLHLRPSGTIAGKPLVKPGTYLLNVRVKDAAGSFDTHRLALRVTS